MSLILTTISRRGIIQAADSNITTCTQDGIEEAGGEKQKVFRVPYLPAALSVAGSFDVGGRSMDEWMPLTVMQYAATTATPSIPGLSQWLCSQLPLSMTQQENSGTLIHLAGYVESNGMAHPEMHYISNILGIESGTGEYSGLRSFTSSEDFWNRDYKTDATKAALRTGDQQLYINGYPAGRIGYLALWGQFDRFLRAMWGQPQWKFRPPDTLQEEALLIELQLRAIGTLFKMSNYPAPYIGGNIQIEQVPSPQNAAPL